MSLRNILGLAGVALSLTGCAPYGYWDQRLAEMPRAFNYGCRNGLLTSNRQEAALYCPRDMPLPPNGVWRPGAAR